MTRAIVCGGRDYTNTKRIWQVLDAAVERLGVDCIIQGGAAGADFQAWQWADVRKVDCIPFAADWKSHGKAAGPKRNQRMIDEGKPDLVIAFPGGVGTDDMCTRARAAGIPVHRITDTAAHKPKE